MRPVSPTGSSTAVSSSGIVRSASRSTRRRSRPEPGEGLGKSREYGHGSRRPGTSVHERSRVDAVRATLAPPRANGERRGALRGHRRCHPRARDRMRTRSRARARAGTGRPSQRARSTRAKRLGVGPARTSSTGSGAAAGLPSARHPGNFWFPAGNGGSQLTGRASQPRLASAQRNRPFATKSR
jgi:hypothetical protein